MSTALGPPAAPFANRTDPLRRRVRLSDVADRAGVAASTASTALNGGSNVAASTRARVLRAADELRYSGADPWARALRTRQSKTICVIPEPGALARSPEHVLRLLELVGDCISENGGFVLWMSVKHESAPMPQCIPVDGVVVLGEMSSELRRELESCRMPIAGLDLSSVRDDVIRGLSEVCVGFGDDEVRHPS
ncbi:LacI family DNA-binding transcriptional regulator [Microbacterium pumilum]|uniref:HTH lacI-type domain-containing protein n=1 Tax=Microbacterium pumilum TaxID=344165 RepID=A0ABP5D2U1_9MICO